MKADFLQCYLDAFSSIQGFFTFDAALLFLAYNQLTRQEGITGDVLEIGLHHGLSAIVVGSLAGRGRRFVAVDLFDELQNQNQSGSGAGNRQVFLRNMQMFFECLDFLEVVTTRSSELKTNELGNQFSFCHIDGGHSAEETYQDLSLCSRVLMPGGLIALDDYFNPYFPGVSEGAVRFQLEAGESLQPLAIGFNKVLFQKQPVETEDLNLAFASAFGPIPAERSILWGTKVNYFTSSFLPFFDLSKSTEESLVLRPQPEVLAVFEPQSSKLEVLRGQLVSLPVTVHNKSGNAFPHGKATLGLSYHLLSSSGRMLKFDNARSYFEVPLQAESSLTTELKIHAPDESGPYLLEMDLVWEGMMWFKEKGNPTCTVELFVK